MTKTSLISSLLLAALIAVVSLPIIYSQGQGRSKLYNKYFPEHLNLTPEKHPISLKYQNQRSSLNRNRARTPDTDQTFGSTPPSCEIEGKELCMETADYPTEKIETMLKSSREKFQEPFEDNIPVTKVMHRAGYGTNIKEHSLCESEEKVIYPKIGKTQENEYEYIVNIKNFTQGVRVEICKNPGNPCEMTQNFPVGYKTECRQKYVYRSLLGFRGKGRIERNLYQIPSCCQCIYYQGII